MSAAPVEEPGLIEEGEGPGEADHALRLALRAWAPAGRSAAGEDPQARLRARLGPDRARRLLDAAIEPVDRAGARHRLRDRHAAEARVDLSRVHPSWWERGLREESPTVRRAVVASAPATIRATLQGEFLLDNDDLRAERAADREVLAWACSLWTERLVGGAAREADDPPIIVAMSSLSLRAAYRLCRHAGALKLAMAGGPGPEWAKEVAAAVGPEFAVVARHDVRASGSALKKLPSRRVPARLGLSTVARLLSDCEPFRVRWALQHWPYAIAKLVRALMPPPAKRSPVTRQVESEILRIARDRVGSA